ncbi:MAG: PAS domain S-box protein [Thermodesulfobacteriota bacterium]
MTGSGPEDLGGLPQWRERILSAILSVGVIMAVLAMIPAAPLWVKERLWGLAAASLGGLAWALVLLFRRSLPFRVRAAGTLVIFYALGLAIFLKLGPLSSAYAWLFAFAVLAGVLAGFRGALLAISLNLAGLLVVNHLHYRGWLAGAAPWYGSPARAFSVGVNFIVLNILVAVSVSVLLRGLAITLKKEEQSTDFLQHERLRLEKEIAEKKEVEKALRESEELFRVLADESPLGISLIDPKGNYRYLNQQFTSMFGYTKEDVPAGPEWFRRAFPDPAYRRQVISTWKDDMDKAGIGQSRARIFNVACKNGEGKTIHFRPVSLADGSQIVLYEDITERVRTEQALQESEKRFRELADFLPEATYEMDLEGRLLFVNRKGYELFQYTREDLESGLRALDMLVAEDRARSYEHATRILEGQDIGLVEYLGLRKDGSTFPALIRAAGIFKEGKPVGLRGILLDISE